MSPATELADGGRERIEPADVAEPILFLCTPLARHVTGAILDVNGGSVLVG